MPAYSTHLANVRAALDDPSALSRYLCTDGTRYALRDREGAPAAAAAAEQQARQAWRELAPTLRGLAKLPWIEGLAVAGAWALGQAPGVGASIDVALLAEGQRGPAAEAAFTASLRSRGPIADRIRLVATYGPEDDDQPGDDLASALFFATLQPITNPAGWAWLRARRPDISEAFPNAPWNAVESTYQLADRLDGRLAVLRRRLLGSGQAVTTAADRRGRRRLRVDDTLARLVQRLAGPSETSQPTIGRTDERWAEVQAWILDAPPGRAAPPPRTVGAEAHPVDAGPASAVTGTQPGITAASPRESSRAQREEDSASAPESTAGRSKRGRGPERRPIRQASAASVATGRRVEKRRSVPAPRR